MRVAEYVVTDQLLDAFRRSLGLVGAAVRTGTSHGWAAPAAAQGRCATACSRP
jgi:hypothetical protein